MGFPEYTCIVFHPEEFGLQFGFEPFKFTGRLLYITFIEGTVQDELREREDEVRKVKLRNARLLKDMKEAKQKLTAFQTVHSIERSSSSKVERRISL
ncbi:PAS domain S-box protein [Sesbania bispinosa]|nr:PAS domain S-box protein [Sesbania bispinosa]